MPAFPHLPFPGIFRKCRLGVRGVCKEGPCLAAAPPGRSVDLPPPLRLSEWDIGLGCVWRHLSEPCAGREVGYIKEVPRSPKEKKKVASRGQGKVHRPIFGPGGGEKGGPSGQTWSGGRCAPFPPQTLQVQHSSPGGQKGSRRGPPWWRPPPGPSIGLPDGPRPPSREHRFLVAIRDDPYVGRLVAPKNCKIYLECKIVLGGGEKGCPCSALLH